MLINTSNGRDAFWHLWSSPDFCAVHFGRIGTTGQWKVYPAHRHADLANRVYDKLDKGYQSEEYLADLPMARKPTSAADAAQALVDTLAEDLDRGDGQRYVCVFPQFGSSLRTRPWLAFLQSVPHAVNEHGLLVAVLPVSHVENAHLEPLAVTPVQEHLEAEQLRVLAALVDRSSNDHTLHGLLRASEALVH